MYNMPRYEQGESSSSSSGKGTNNGSVSNFSGFQVTRSPPDSRNYQLFSSTPWLMNSFGFPEPRTPPSRRNRLGKHSVRVELNRLNQEILLLREELKALENTPSASRACKELVEFMETCADPLLPVTPGPVVAEWDRWSRQGVNRTRSCSCCW